MLWGMSLSSMLVPLWGSSVLSQQCSGCSFTPTSSGLLTWAVIAALSQRLKVEAKALMMVVMR